MQIFNFLLIAFVTYSFTANSAESKLDSLKSEAKQTNLTISEKANLFLTIGSIYDENEQYDSSVHYLKIALKQFRTLSDYDQIANTLNTLGKNHSFSGDDVKSLTCFREVLNISDKLSGRVAIADAFHNIGIVYEYEGKPDSSFYYYKKALEERELLGDTSKIASSLRAMGEILRSMDRLDEALAYCLRALSYKNYIKDKQTLANIYNETGYLYELNGKIDTALSYYQNLIELCQDIGLKRGEAIGLANSAVIYERLEQYDKALEYHFKALEVDKELGYGYGIMKDYYLIAITYKLLKKYNVALSYLQRSDSLCNTKWSLDNQEIQELYYKIYKETGSVEKALAYYEQYALIKDSISNTTLKSKIVQLHAEYESEKKESKIEYLNAENELKDQRLKLSSFLLGSLVLIGILIVILLLLILRQKELRIQNMHIELRNFLLEVEELKSAITNREEWDNNKINELLTKYEITEREADVLHMISHGNTNHEIAEKLFISINTVKFHIKNLYLKLDAKNRIEIVNRFSPERISAS